MLVPVRWVHWRLIFEVIKGTAGNSPDKVAAAVVTGAAAASSAAAAAKDAGRLLHDKREEREERERERECHLSNIIHIEKAKTGSNWSLLLAILDRLQIGKIQT